MSLCSAVKSGRDFLGFVFVPVCDWNASFGCKVRKPCVNFCVWCGYTITVSLVVEKL